MTACITSRARGCCAPTCTFPFRASSRRSRVVGFVSRTSRHRGDFFRSNPSSWKFAEDGALHPAILLGGNWRSEGGQANLAESWPVGERMQGAGPGGKQVPGARPFTTVRLASATSSDVTNQSGNPDLVYKRTSPTSDDDAAMHAVLPRCFSPMATASCSGGRLAPDTQQEPSSITFDQSSAPRPHRDGHRRVPADFTEDRQPNSSSMLARHLPKRNGMASKPAVPQAPVSSESRSAMHATI